MKLLGIVDGGFDTDTVPARNQSGRDNVVGIDHRGIDVVRTARKLGPIDFAQSQLLRVVDDSRTVGNRPAPSLT
jgi:hypothetical protein